MENGDRQLFRDVGRRNHHDALMSYENPQVNSRSFEMCFIRNRLVGVTMGKLCFDVGGNFQKLVEDKSSTDLVLANDFLRDDDAGEEQTGTDIVGYID